MKSRSNPHSAQVGAIEEIAPDPNLRRVEFVGTATSHFQAEPLLTYSLESSRVHSDWELELARRLGGQSCGIPNAEISNLPRFLYRKEQYIRRSRELSQNMFRFSLDFARLCPDKGQFSEELMTEYIKVLALIRTSGQEPFLTLHHFTMPRSLIQTDPYGNLISGAWENRDIIQHFRFYIRNVVRFLTDELLIRRILSQLKINGTEADRIISEGTVRYFMTINEPTAVLYNGYVSGIFPPYRKASLRKACSVLEKLVEAHDLAFDEIKRGLQMLRYEPQVGLGYSWPYFDGAVGTIAQEIQDYCTRRFERTGNRSDFLGIHYYFRRTIPLGSRKRLHRDYSDQPTFGDIYPVGVLDVLREAHAQYPAKDIFVSEIGFSDKTDLRRPFWILETVQHLLREAESNTPIKGVLLWSLVDNFEWDLGMSQKFGLFNEADLAKPLSQSSNGIRSWEAWRAATRAILSPSSESLRELQRCYTVAYAQYREAGGKYERKMDDTHLRFAPDGPDKEATSHG